MKKLFILTPAMLLTGILYSAADTSIVEVSLLTKDKSIVNIKVPIDWSTETFQSLACKLYSNATYQDYFMSKKNQQQFGYYDENDNPLPIQYFTWGKSSMDIVMSGNIHKVDLAKLKDVIANPESFGPLAKPRSSIQASHDNYDEVKEHFGKK